MSRFFIAGFGEEIAKLAAPPNARPATPAYASAIPVQPIPSGAAPAPQQAFRPPTPSAPAYQRASPAAATPPKKTGGTAASPVSNAWSQMADRAPTESTSKFVSRRYGVPERQMGVNEGKTFPDASDPKRPQYFRSLAGSVPMDESQFPALRAPQLKDTSTMNVPQYLQRAVGGISHQPKPYLMPEDQGRLGYRAGSGWSGAEPATPKPTTATTTAQPLQAGT